MNHNKICFTPATQLAKAVREKHLSPVEIIEAILSHIDANEPRLNAFATRTNELARAAAKLSEREVMRGEQPGDLHGIPVTLKDLTLTAGVPTQRGSLTHAGFTPDEDAPIVTCIKNAGGIILGKTTVSEFGWSGVSHSPLHGVTSNPWKLGYNAGGSSAGAGVGAAAGFGPLHQGSDGAGSVRIPAHFCGVFGLKPTFGLIPFTAGSTADQLYHVGPLTRTVADAALFLKVLVRGLSTTGTTGESKVADYPNELKADISTLRVAYSPDLGHASVDPEVADLVEDAVTAFEDFGCRVEQVTPHWGCEGPHLVRFFWTYHRAGLANYLPQWESQMDAGLVACIKAGMRWNAADYDNMKRERLQYVGKIEDFFHEYDLLLTPAVSVAAFPATELQPLHWPQHDWDWIRWAEFSYPFNLSGNPAASIPCGFTADRLPVGLQIVGRRFDELSVLRASAAFEEARPWKDAYPALD